MVQEKKKQEAITKTEDPSAPKISHDAKTLLKKRLEFERAKDHKMVKGQFKYYENPGGVLPFSYKKYPGDKELKYKLEDGLYYELPLMVARHLNTGGVIQEYEYKTDALGKPIMRIGHRRHRTGFQSLEFTSDFDDARRYDNIVLADPIAQNL